MKGRISLLNRGFTLIELIVVITVIGILAAVVIVAYNGIQQNARDKSVLSDLDALDGIETQYGIKNNTAGLAWYSGDGVNPDLNFTPSADNVIDIVTNSTDYCMRAYNPSSATYKTLATAAIKESTKDACATLPPSNEAGGTNDSLLGWWKFNGNSDDSSSYGSNGTVFGATLTTGENGVNNSAYLFNRTTGDYIEILDAPQQSPNSNNLSISVWFRVNSLGGGLSNSLVYNKDNLYELSAGGGYVTYAWQPHWNWDGGTSFPITIGVWYNAIVVYDGSNQYLYKNGSLVYSRPQTGSIGANTSRLAIGTRGASGGGNGPFDGSIDDLRIYNRALSLQEIQNIYSDGAQ